MSFAILMANENVACAATYGGGGSAKIGTSRESTGGEENERVEEFAERASHGASAVCALSLSARAGEIRAEPVPCVQDGWLSHV